MHPKLETTCHYGASDFLNLELDFLTGNHEPNGLDDANDSLNLKLDCLTRNYDLDGVSASEAHLRFSIIRALFMYAIIDAH